jgi:sugar phosphate isomerase/epimerase
MKLAISGQALGNTLSLEEILMILKKHNIKFIELWPENIPGVYKAINDENRFRAEIKKVNDLLKKYGIQVCCVTSAFACDLNLANNPELFLQKFIKMANMTWQARAWLRLQPRWLSITPSW